MAEREGEAAENELSEGWREALRREAAETLAALPPSMKPMRERPPFVCADCGHQHTPDGCTGDPTPSDLWAGVSVSGCDCDEGESR